MYHFHLTFPPHSLPLISYVSPSTFCLRVIPLYFGSMHSHSSRISLHHLFLPFIFLNFSLLLILHISIHHFPVFLNFELTLYWMSLFTGKLYSRNIPYSLSLYLQWPLPLNTSGFYWKFGDNEVFWPHIIFLLVVPP